MKFYQLRVDKLNFSQILQLIECYIQSEVYGIRFKELRFTMLSKMVGEVLYLNPSDIYYIQVNKQRSRSLLLDWLRLNYSFSHNYESSKYPEWMKIDINDDLLQIDMNPTIHDNGTYYLQIYGFGDLIYFEVEILVYSK